MCDLATGLNLQFLGIRGKLGNWIMLHKFFVGHKVVLASSVSSMYKFYVILELHVDEHFVYGR
jgi:hypothetical protein